MFLSFLFIIMSGKKIALLIGINYFGTNSELSGCINDIMDIQLALQKYGYTEFHILTDAPNNGITAIPTAKNIVQKVKECVGRLSAGDTLYFHYSGHGSYLRDQTLYKDGRDEKDGFDECICTVDDVFIRDDDLRKLMVDNLPKGAKLRAVFDSCHSGSVLDLPLRWIGGSVFGVENTDYTEADAVMISGCKDYQTSADASFAGKYNGALTKALLAELGENATAKTWEDLAANIRAFLISGGYTQVPQLGFTNKTKISQKVDV
jgi:metacaspase-1